MRRVGTGETYVGEIPLQLFQADNFKQQLYLGKATEIVLEGLEDLKVSRKEPIHICTGYVLSKATDELKKKGYEIIQKKIVGDTQFLAEREFIKSLVRLSVGDEAKVSGMRSFNSLLRWVREDLENRERYVKTGWQSWPKYRKEGERLKP